LYDFCLKRYLSW